jgi:ankyrin repeat protein
MHRRRIVAVLSLALAFAGAAASTVESTSGSPTMLDALFAAIRAQDLASVERLVDNDPTLLGQRNAQGISPLSWAAYLQQQPIVVALRQRRGMPDFFEACIIGDDAVVDAAIAAHQDVNVPAPDGFTAVGLAVFFGHPGLARRLLDAGADVNARSSNAQRVAPIHATLAHNDVSTLELLLVRGADPNLPQERGVRPLHEAASSGSLPAVALLLMFGADPRLASEDGRLPADLARAKGHEALAVRLESLARPRS